MQQADALRGAAGFADGFRVHADDLAVLADQHDLRLLGDLRDADNFAVALGGLHVDDTFTAAIGQTVFVGGRALAISVLGNGEDQRTFLRYQVSVFFQPSTP